MIKCVKFGLLVLVVGALFGCAKSKHNIRLSESFWKESKRNIVIAKAKPKNKPGLRKKGNQGLLDMAVVAVATNVFNKHLQKTDLGWYKRLPQKFSNQLAKRKILSKIYSTDIEPKQKENIVSVVQMGGDKVLLLELLDMGAVRNYYSFVPTGAPKAYCELKGELINKKTKKILWRHQAKIEEVVRGDWDQPPHYPNFSVAMKLAIDSAQEEVLDSFFSGH